MALRLRMLIKQKCNISLMSWQTREDVFFFYYDIGFGISSNISRGLLFDAWPILIYPKQHMTVFLLQVVVLYKGSNI